MTSKVFIIIPSFNEGIVIRQTILGLDGKYNIVVVDDASTDNTDLMISDLPIYYLKHPINLGQGASLQTGMEFALKEGADIAVHFDADGQHNQDDIERFIHKLQNENLDIVLGSRFIKREHTNLVPPFKRLILRIARLLNGLMTGMWLTDAHNGFRVMNRKSLKLIRLKENRMAHATEILSQININKLSYAELDTQIIYTEHSIRKGQSWTNSFNILFELLVNRYLR